MNHWHFKAAEPVPAWLVDVEPAIPGRGAPTVTFAEDCDVIELEERFIVFNRRPNPRGCIVIEGATGEVYGLAADKAVYVADKWTIVRADHEAIA
jgi:hypothetical protein